MVETQTLEKEAGGASGLPGPHLPSLFRGRGQYGIDDKGRLTIPQQMRKPLLDGGNLVVLDGRAVIWTEETFQQAVDHLQSVVDGADVLQQHVRGFVSNTHPVSLDSQGRIVIPPAVRVEADLDSQVLVLGSGPRIELLPAGTDDLDAMCGVHDSIVDALDRANF